ncbi:hypothetical protein DFH28DRAFT_1087224 [Melampsora americana]|nr:hypothetical protein DFH28DRAFT_1087224 [Melampsora americana]
MEPQHYAQQMYSSLFHQPFNRPSTDPNLIFTGNYQVTNPLEPPQSSDLMDTRMMNINQSHQAESTQPVPFDTNEDHQLLRLQCAPLIDNRPRNNQAHQPSQTQQMNINPPIPIDPNHYLSAPHPQRSSATMNSGSSFLQLSTFSESQPLTSTGPSSFESTTHNPTATSQGLVTTSQSANGKKKKSAARPKKQTETGNESLEKNQPNCEEQGSSALKSSKAMVDSFLLPSSRLPDSVNLPEQLTVEELYKLDASQLRRLADKHSTGPGKGSMSEAKKKILRDFQISTEKIYAILCIHLGISQNVAASEIGRWASHRLPRAYDHFKKSNEVRKIYRENGGATNRVAIALVKQLWDSLSLEEQNAYHPKEIESDTEDNKTEDDSDQGDCIHPDALPDHRPAQKGLTTIVRGSNDESTRKNGFLASSRNLAYSKAKCAKFVADFIKQANSMSRIHPVQFAIVAVSTHLSEHCFQYMSTTPGLWQWVEHDLNSSSNRESTTSKMQAFVTGKSVAGLARLKRPRGTTVEVDKLKAHLNNIIRSSQSVYSGKATNNPDEIWKWLNCEDRLAAEGFNLLYEPSISIYRNWITSPNCSLTEEKARQVNNDLISHPVSLTPISDFIRQYKGKNKKRKVETTSKEDHEVLQDVNEGVEYDATST